MISPLPLSSPAEPAEITRKTGPVLVPVGQETVASSIDLDGFPRATPELLERRALLRRSDTKFLGGIDHVREVLPRLTSYYALLGSAQYYTLYFDTVDFRCFHDHRRGRRLRHKVRIRHYEDRQLTYLEVKSRANNAVTNKNRIALPYQSSTLGEAERAFIEQHTGIAGASLEPVLWINYRRITLLSLSDNERFTIDMDLRVAPPDDRDGLIEDLAGVAFFEIKQAPLRRDTPVVKQLRSVGLRERSISKYCAGVIYADPAARHNRLRPVVRALEKVRP